jgi:hypothetical protein
VVAALPLAALAFGACFDGDVPTKQIGGTEFGLLLNVASPVRVPAATFTARAAPTTTTLDSLIVTFTNLKPLAGAAAYRFYAVDATFNAGTPVAARLTALRRDSTVTGAGTIAETTDSSELGTSTFFHGARPNTTVRARFGGAQFTAAHQLLVVTIEEDSTRPLYDYTHTPMPLWLRFRNAAAPNAVITSGSAIFGKFSPSTPRPFVALGRGRSAFWDRFNDMRLLYSAIVEGLTQPPLGYYYQPWLRDTRTRRAVRFGELRDETGASLRDADLMTIPGSVAQIPIGRFETSEDSVGSPLMSFDGVHLVLEPKLGDTTLSLASVLVGTLGDTLGLRGTGAIEVLARRGQDSVAGVQVIVRALNGTVAVGQPRPATTADDEPVPSDKGRVIITRIPAGEVELLITPPAGMTAPATRPRVTVQRGDTATVTINLN